MFKGIRSSSIALTAAIVTVLFSGITGGYLLGTKSSKIPSSREIAQTPSVVTLTPTPLKLAFTYLQSCSFSVQTPEKWNIHQKSDPLFTGIGNMFGCARIEAPDYNAATNQGLYIRIDRIDKNSTYKGLPLTGKDTYVSAIQTVKPGTIAETITDKTIGAYKGKSFDMNLFDTNSFFVFETGKYIYSIYWPRYYTGTYSHDIDTIIMHLDVSSE